MQKEITKDFDSTDHTSHTQLENLKAHFEYLKVHSAFYQKIFEAHQVDQINSVDDLRQIPFTKKSDLEKYQDAFLCVAQKKIVEFVSTSGTLGNPISIALTKKDLDRLAYNEARSLTTCGITDNDVVQITTTLDKRFMAGMAYYLGATKIGAAVIRSGIGDMSFQWDNILRYKPTVLIAVPSFAYKLGLYLQEQGEDLAHLPIEKIVCIGEPIRDSNFEPNRLLQKTQELWKRPMYSTYASTEMATAFTECEAGQGGHIIPELMVVEIVDEEGNQVTDGELGEVVATPLQVEGMPLLRYKTGDLARLHKGKCSCGRNTPRLGPVEGRKEQMIKFKGTTLYPEQIENVLHGIEEIDQYLIELNQSELGLDHVRIYVSDTLSSDILSKVQNQLAEKLRVRPEVLPLSAREIFKKSMAQKSRKPRRFIDIRTAK